MPPAVKRSVVAQVGDSEISYPDLTARWEAHVKANGGNRMLPNEYTTLRTVEQTFARDRHLVTVEAWTRLDGTGHAHLIRATRSPINHRAARYDVLGAARLIP